MSAAAGGGDRPCRRPSPSQRYGASSWFIRCGAGFTPSCGADACGPRYLLATIAVERRRRRAAGSGWRQSGSQRGMRQHRRKRQAVPVWRQSGRNGRKAGSASGTGVRIRSRRRSLDEEEEHATAGAPQRCGRVERQDLRVRRRHPAAAGRSDSVPDQQRVGVRPGRRHLARAGADARCAPGGGRRGIGRQDLRDGRRRRVSRARE